VRAPLAKALLAGALAMVVAPVAGTLMATTHPHSLTHSRTLVRVPPVRAHSLTHVRARPLTHAHTRVSAPTPTTLTPVSDATSTDTPDWACIRERESRDNYTESGMEPEGGAYQFNLVTWASLGFSGTPAGSPAWVQDRAALALYKWDARYTWSPWSAWQTAPACGL
jgi:hypothetical protein